MTRSDQALAKNMLIGSLVATLAGWSGTLCAQGGVPFPEARRPLEIQGETYAPSCAPPHLEILKNSVMELAGRKLPLDTWLLINALLCRNDPSSSADIARYTKKKILLRHEGTGQSPMRSYVTGAEHLLARGDVWNATAISASSNSVRVSFSSNEVCVSDFVLRFTGRRWLLAEAGQACD